MIDLSPWIRTFSSLGRRLLRKISAIAILCGLCVLSAPVVAQFDQPFDLPARVQAEDYLPGQGIGFYDTTPGNRVRAYRDDDVDVGPIPGGAGYVIAWFVEDEYLKYQIRVSETNTYRVRLRVNTAQPARTIHVEIDDEDAFGPIAIPQQTTWSSYIIVDAGEITVEAGLHFLTLKMRESRNVNVDWVEFIEVDQRVLPIPGKIEAEDYDVGANGTAYFDTTSGNVGGAYRNDDVDIAPTQDSGGGFHVGWMAENEWLRYTVDVAEDDTYRVIARVGSAFDDRNFRIEVDGQSVGGSVAVPTFDDWDQYSDVVIPNIALTKGRHTLRFIVGATGYLDFNWLEFQPDDGGGTLRTPPPARFPTGVGGDAAAKSRQLGIAVSYDAYQSDPAYRGALLNNGTSIVAENVMKFGPLQPVRGQFNFGQADTLVNFANDNNFAVRGHTLIWAGQNPNWINNGNWTRESLIEVMREHINAVLTHFRGRVDAWDVVNEAFLEDGSRRQNIWQRVIGDDYIDIAFSFAAAADPNVMLFYNDYNISFPVQKFAKVSATQDLIRQLKSRNIPIHGVGMQMHYDASGWHPGAENLRTVIRDYASLGVEVHMTELDVRIPQPTTTAKLNQQADIFEYTARVCQTEPACTSLTMWGITDRHSWIPNAFPNYDDGFILDREYAQKPAYFGLKRGFQ